VKGIEMTKIVSAFPATGKSHFFKNTNELVLDSDSSKFSWIEPGVRHPNFPQNYIDHIKYNIGKTKYILVSSHKVVRDVLVNNKIFFSLVYPVKNIKDEYLNRCKKRGSDQKFIDMLDNNWDSFLDEMKEQKHCDHLILLSGEFISDIIWEVR
jgi:hypothetical protein